ncbi:MAG TPA: hypothetical protein VMU92_07055 [Acidobacteriaceae bacterium]|nr:hypothetical protein [Terracidiphilus sp.]HUY81464.1 hypothetical protein [Acidobacteriaceae bacterium]
MSQPVKLSDALVLDARIAGDAQERSIAGQVEFWAKLGRSVELLLRGGQVAALRRGAEVQPLSEALALVDTPAGRKRVQAVLASRPYPHFKQCPGRPGLLIRIEEDGTQTVGRFVNRTFIAVDTAERRDTKATRSAASRSARQQKGREACA